jgi:hypothetical protein
LRDIEVILLIISGYTIVGDLISNLHIAVGCVQDETFNRAPEAVAFGVYVPSHMFIKCMLYHCLIPSFPASLSATSPLMPSNSLPIFPPIDLGLFWDTLRNIAPKDGVESEGLFVGIKVFPSVEVFN